MDQVMSLLEKDNLGKDNTTEGIEITLSDGADDILGITVVFTNQYITFSRQKYSHEMDDRFTDKIEIKAFIGLLHSAGLLHSNKQKLEELWESDGFAVDLFHLVMSIQ